MAMEGNGSWKSFVLQVDMHCRCIGCLEKINKAISSIKNFEEVARISKDIESGKVTVVANMDPQKLRDWLQNKTKKKVDIVFPTKPSSMAKLPQLKNRTQKISMTTYEESTHRKITTITISRDAEAMSKCSGRSRPLILPEKMITYKKHTI